MVVFRIASANRSALGCLTVPFVVVMIAMSGTAVGATDLSAQITNSDRTAGEGDGLWWGIGIGGGGTRLTCDICQPSRDLGPSADVTLGAYASDQLRVGVEIGAWTHEEDEDLRETVYRVSIVAHLVPDLDRGFYLLGGFGWSGYRANEFRYNAPRATFGAGWDLPLASGWLIGNQIALDASSFGALKNEETAVARGVGLSTVRLVVYLRRE